jgi:hypothetical protein
MSPVTAGPPDHPQATSTDAMFVDVDASKPAKRQ